MKLFEFIKEDAKEKRQSELESIFEKHEKKIAILTLADAQFIFSQVEKELIETVEIGKKIYERCYALLTIFAGLLIGLVSFTISRLVEIKRFDSVLETTILSITYFLCLGIVLILPNIQPIKYSSVGSLPEEYFDDDNIVNQNTSNLASEVSINLLTSEMLSYSYRVFNNKTINEKRWKLYRAGLISLFISPIVIFIIFGFTYYLEHYA